MSRWAPAFALVLVAACGPEPRLRVAGVSSGVLPEEPALALSTSNRAMVDGQGRVRWPRSLQHHSLQDVDYRGREFDSASWAHLRSNGFELVRVAISWSALEPTRGQVDAPAVAAIRAELDAAHAAGMGVILEWHQDLWGRCVTEVGSVDRRHANGAPDWTCPANATQGISPHWLQFTRLFENQNGLLDALERTQGEVFGQLLAHPAVLAVEPMNEPAGPSDGLEQVLFPYYRRFVQRVRAAGFQGLVLLDAPVFRNETFEMVTEDLSGLGEGVVFAPHLYSGWFTQFALDTGVTGATRRKDFAKAQEQAQALGLALFNGEWGIHHALPSAREEAEVVLRFSDELGVPGSYWAWSKQLPDEEQGVGDSSGKQAVLQADGTPVPWLWSLLTRPGPLAVPGTSPTARWDEGSQTLTLGFQATGSDAPLVLWAPERWGRCLQASSTGPSPSLLDAREPERLRLQYPTAGAVTLTLAPCATR